jgi:FkbM family methyltransferase
LWTSTENLYFKELCKISDIIFDIGSNTGIYSLLAQTINSKAKVFAFEPVKRIYDKLLKNINLNQYHIETFEIAISNYSGKATIYDTESEHSYTVTLNKNSLQNSVRVIPVEIITKTLDNFINENKLGKIDLIKIDVETHEPEVLEGFSGNISLMRPTILIIRFNYTAIIGLFICLIILTLGTPLFFQWFVSKEYASATIYVFWVGLGYFFWAIYLLYTGIIFYYKKTNFLGLLALVNILLSIVLNYFLIKSFGALGAAYASCISYFVVAFVVVWKAQTMTKLNRLNVVPV